MPILLYATEVCPLTLSDIRSLDIAIFRFLMKLLKTNNKDIINDCCSFFALNCQVNEYKVAKLALIRNIVIFEAITKCL